MKGEGMATKQPESALYCSTTNPISWLNYYSQMNF